jgi:uncharacterized membrane protein YvbJ
MYCKNCTQTVHENARFCSNCGYNFEVNKSKENELKMPVNNRITDNVDFKKLYKNKLLLFGLIIGICFIFFYFMSFLKNENHHFNPDKELNYLIKKK